jgi:hypothetical protein
VCEEDPFKLCDIRSLLVVVVVVTVPSTTAAVEKSYLTFNGIKLYVISTQKQEMQMVLH